MVEVAPPDAPPLPLVLEVCVLPPLPVVAVLATEVRPVELELLAVLEAAEADEPPLPADVEALESPSLDELDSEEAAPFSALPQPNKPWPRMSPQVTTQNERMTTPRLEATGVPSEKQQ